jgi:hypothetical protein
MDKAVLSRFMNGRGGLSTEVLDKIGERLKLAIVVRGRKAK